jgi:hypothetical protein
VDASYELEILKAANAALTADRTRLLAENGELREENERLEGLFQRTHGVHHSWVAEVAKLRARLLEATGIIGEQAGVECDEWEGGASRRCVDKYGPDERCLPCTARAFLAQPRPTPTSEASETPLRFNCTVCNDTHRMERDGRGSVMCTWCPTPCAKCRSGGLGAYCETTPCPCDCHASRRARERADAASSSSPTGTEAQEAWPCTCLHEHESACPLAPAPEAEEAAVCSVCNDTHRMPSTGWLCTHCPVPCQKCRIGGTGPFCATTPCGCDCHHPRSRTGQKRAERREEGGK